MAPDFYLIHMSLPHWIDGCRFLLCFGSYARFSGVRPACLEAIQVVARNTESNLVCVPKINHVVLERLEINIDSS